VNNSELKELLRRVHVPERKSEEWKELSDNTLRGLRASLFAEGGRGQVALAPSRRKSFALWAAGLATACIVAGFFFGHWHAGRNSRRDEIADARKLFAELSSMFPNQLEAVLLDGSTPRLVLAEKTSANQGVPIFVRLCGAGGCQRVITFSGRRVALNGETCEVLLDARGHVIVTGDRFAWSSGDTAALPGGYRIEAAPLTETL
jgi:hypothetical protein